MSGYKSSDFRHDCAKHGCYQEVHAPDFSWMKGCFPRGIMPSDLDGVVEINGHVLFIEHKGVGGFVDGGQSRLLRVLEKYPDAVVWLIRKTTDPDRFECIYRDGETTASGWQPYTIEQMQTWIRTWAEAADAAKAAS